MILRPQAAGFFGLSLLPLPFCRRTELVVLGEEVEGKRGPSDQPQWLPRPEREKAPPTWLHALPLLPPTGLQFVLAKVPMLGAGLGFFSLA